MVSTPMAAPPTVVTGVPPPSSSPVPPAAAPGTGSALSSPARVLPGLRRGSSAASMTPTPEPPLARSRAPTDASHVDLPIDTAGDYVAAAERHVGATSGPGILRTLGLAGAARPSPGSIDPIQAVAKARQKGFFTFRPLWGGIREAEPHSPTKLGGAHGEAVDDDDAGLPLEGDVADDE